MGGGRELLCSVVFDLATQTLSPQGSAFFKAPDSAQKDACQPGRLLASVTFAVQLKFCIETVMQS